MSSVLAITEICDNNPQQEFLQEVRGMAAASGYDLGVLLSRLETLDRLRLLIEVRKEAGDITEMSLLAHSAYAVYHDCLVLGGKRQADEIMARGTLPPEAY